MIRLENIGPAFTGWTRTTTDAQLPPVSRIGDTILVLGRSTGLGVRVLDVYCTLFAGDRLDLDPAQAEPDPTWVRGPLPDPSWAGGPLAVNGNPMDWVVLRADGAGYLMHLRSRVGAMICVDVWVVAYPGQPWMVGEVMCTASQPLVPNLSAQESVSISFGSAYVHCPFPLTPQLADGQSVAYPIAFGWLSRFGLAEVQSFVSAAQLNICAVGVERMRAEGNPRVPVGFDAHAWAKARFVEAIRRLYTYEKGIVGPNPRSADTGGQEDEGISRGEMFCDGGAPAAMVVYLSALKLAMRPIRHLEVDGSPMTGASTSPPRPTILWNGRPHAGLWNMVDRRGKPTPLAEAAVPGGWSGPDVEHAFAPTLFAAARATGSPALQQIMRCWAMCAIHQWTTTPGWSTTQPYAARAVGWEGMLAVDLWDNLEDRVLASQVADHWRARWDTVLSTTPRMLGPVWDIRTDDARLGTGQWWLPWQQAVGAYGLDGAGERFGRQAAREMALAAALVVLDASYRQTADGKWVATSQMPVDPARDAETVRSDAWAWFGNALAVATVLRHDPQHGRARAIWTYLLANAGPQSQWSWLAPEVQ